MGIFGGTFDPIHYGHLRTAFELMEALALSEVRFIPAGSPPHRDRPHAAAGERLNMVRAALANQPGFTVDDREIARMGPSFSVDTLSSLRAEFADRPLCLIIGMDAFLGLPKWHRWEHLLELAHIIVAHRPGWRVPDTGPLQDLVRSKGTGRYTDLHDATAGRVFVHAVTQLEISSTDLRALIHAGQDPRFLMPDAVRELIATSGCYR
jgi:nicotinate-nucleotide adenylyltransferase